MLGALTVFALAALADLASAAATTFAKNYSCVKDDDCTPVVRWCAEGRLRNGVKDSGRNPNKRKSLHGPASETIVIYMKAMVHGA